jgi:HAE1 family hydrophobic/amphiphilic exporter-1
MRNRLPEDAEPPTIFKFDSSAQPIMQIGVEGDFDPVTLREAAQNELAPRFERVDGVAAVTVNGGLRRQIHVELSKEKVTALNLSVNQVVQTLPNRNRTRRSARSIRATPRSWSAARGSSPAWKTSATWW